MSTNARAVDVRNAVVALLNSGPVQATFGAQTFTAVPGYIPQYDLTQHAGLLVTVMAAELHDSPLDRGHVKGMVAADVGVQKAIDATGDVVAQCDALMLLVEQIKQALEPGLTLAEDPNAAQWIGTDNDPIYDPKMLKEKSVFTSVPRFTFLTERIL